MLQWATADAGGHLPFWLLMAQYHDHYRYETDSEYLSTFEESLSDEFISVSTDDYERDTNRSTSMNSYSDDARSEVSEEDLEETGDYYDDWADDAPTASFDGTSSERSNHGSAHESDVEEENKLKRNGSYEYDEAEQIQQSKGVERTLPTEVWTETEIERGFLLSKCKYAPRVSPKTPSSADRTELNRVAETHLVWRRYKIETDTVEESAEEFASQLYYMAEYYEHTCGKWVVYVPEEHANEIWNSLSHANESGLLGGRVECYPLENSTFRFCVRVNDFSDTEDAITTLHALHECTGRYGRIACFKPDFLSELGIYHTMQRNGARYTFAELGLSKTWMPRKLHKALLALGQRGNQQTQGRRRGTRGGRRRRRKRTGPSITKPTSRWEANPYQTNVRHTPSRPNGLWDEEETTKQQIEHHSGYAPRAAPRAIRDLPTLERRAKRLLNSWDASGRSKEEKRAFMAKLYSLAASHDYVIGKWKVFVPARVADKLWAAVCEANEEGELGGCLKLCKYNPRSGCFLLCVYVNDFTDVRECRRVLRIVSGICARFDVNVIANFKADFLTHLGVYRIFTDARDVKYSLTNMGLGQTWPYQPLEEVLDHEKRKRRGQAVGE